MVGRPAKTQIRVFAVRMKKAWVLSYPLSAQRRLWSDWADVQADLSLRWVHTHFVGFVMLWLKCNHLEKQVSWLFDENLGVIFHISKLKNVGIHYNDEYPQHVLVRWFLRIPTVYIVFLWRTEENYPYHQNTHHICFFWASSRENLSSGFATR